MAVFVATVETGSMAAAARALELNAALVGKQIQQLEQQLGARLFEQKGRWQRLTPAGQQYFGQCRGILELVRGAEAQVQSLPQADSVTLRVHAPVWFGSRFLAPALSDFLTAHETVQVDLCLDDRGADPLDDGYDIVFHLGPLPADDLDLIPLAEQAVRMIAAPSYLSRHGTPLHPDELLRHRCLGFMASGADQYPDAEAEAESVDEQGVEDASLDNDALAAEGLAPRICVQSNNAHALHALALSGAGITVLPDALVADDVAAGRLVCLLPDHLPPAEPLGLLIASAGPDTPARQAFIDWALERLGTPA
jgi:DNA-binding transcriptional LysR family regulator